jgi:thiamine-monophosphate kinase
MYISELDEFSLIARLTQGLPTRKDVVRQVGDDCAVLDLGGEVQLLATCDCQVEGVHFTLQTSQPELIGRKALAVNLSDIAAMGGEPRYALISLVLPSHCPVALLDGIYDGLRKEAAEYATAIVGGNIAGSGQSEQLVIDITLLGNVERGRALLRSGARPGDLLYVTGTLGDSGAGLYTLLSPDEAYPQDALMFVQARHRTPIARVKVGCLLSRLGTDVITAMLDVSDGISGDLGHLCEQSHVGAQVDLERLPLSRDIGRIASCAGYDPYQWALHGGEDYELLFAVAPGHEEQLRDVQSQTGVMITRIGVIGKAEMGMQLCFPDGHCEPLIVKSWNHLRSGNK